jgi:hypothetical protein
MERLQREEFAWELKSQGSSAAKYSGKAQEALNNTMDPIQAPIRILPKSGANET